MFEQQKKTKKYDSGRSEDTTATFEDSKSFRIKIFYVTLDFITSELEGIVQAYENVLAPFNFLFVLEDVCDFDVRKDASKLKNIYSCDLDDDFIDECVHFKCFMDDIKREMELDNETFQEESDSDDNNSAEGPTKKKKVSKPAKMLKYIKKTRNRINISKHRYSFTHFRMYCSSQLQWYFLALKRVKNFQRTTVKEEKLNNVGILYIESDILNQLDTNAIIEKFINLKNRKRGIYYRGAMMFKMLIYIESKLPFSNEFSKKISNFC